MYTDHGGAASSWTDPVNWPSPRKLSRQMAFPKAALSQASKVSPRPWEHEWKLELSDQLKNGRLSGTHGWQRPEWGFTRLDASNISFYLKADEEHKEDLMEHVLDVTTTKLLLINKDIEYDCKRYVDMGVACECIGWRLLALGVNLMYYSDGAVTDKLTKLGDAVDAMKDVPRKDAHNWIFHLARGMENRNKIGSDPALCGLHVEPWEKAGDEWLLPFAEYTQDATDEDSDEDSDKTVDMSAVDVSNLKDDNKEDKKDDKSVGSMSW